MMAPMPIVAMKICVSKLADFSIGEQLVTQSLAALYTIILSGVVSIALLVLIKARVLALSYLELCHAAPVFQRIVTAFSLVVPVALALVAWWER